MIESADRMLHGSHGDGRIPAQRIRTPGSRVVAPIGGVPCGKQQSERQPIEGCFAILNPEFLRLTENRYGL